MSQPPQTRSLRHSRDLLARARAVIPGASQTLSKGPSQWVQGVAPIFLAGGVGAYVTDVDGNRYLDLGAGLGPIILGYQHPAVDAAIRKQLSSGITFTLPHRLEVEVAERVCAMVPGAERIRFAKSGSDATSAAVRLARIFTGREHIIATGYHGGHDWYMAASRYREGIPKALQSAITQIRFGDLERMERVLRLKPTAAVIMEPVGTHVPTAADLQDVIDLAHAHGALVVFDEVITGFRLAPGGAQEHYGVQADLACFGKALGNGMPISAVTGRADVMANVMFLSYTHAGEALSLAAAKATLDVFATRQVTPTLWDLGGRLRDHIRYAITDHGLSEWVQCQGLPPRTVISVREPHSRDGALPAKSLLQQELLKRGILWNGNQMVSYAMTFDDIDRAGTAFDEALGILASALPDDVEARLEGSTIQAVFWADAR